MTCTFRYVSGTKFETLDTITAQTDFYNLKNKAEGARRYGYTAKTMKGTDPTGAVAFYAEFQTTLNGSSYQSPKRSAFVATEAEARALLAKTIAGAQKRYAKLALDPASKIEQRTSPSNAKLAQAFNDSLGPNAMFKFVGKD
jgi:hypothetical protein